MWMMALGAMQGALEASGNIKLMEINQDLQFKMVAANRTKSAGANIASKAQGNLARWAQSVNNQRRLEAGGKQLEVNAINFGRQLDAAVTSGFSQSIGAAEAAGRAGVAAAFSGISGDVVDSVNLSTRIRDRMVREQTQKNVEMAKWDFAQRQALTATQTIRGLDSSYILDNLDYTMGYTQQQWTPSIGQGAFAGMAPYLKDTISNWGSKSTTERSYGNSSNYTGMSNDQLATQFNFSGE